MLIASPVFRRAARRRRRRLDALDPATVQSSVLIDLVRRARTTRFGRDHALAEIEDVPGYQARVPLRRYEDFWVEYWAEAFPTLIDCTWPGAIPYFANTSGTTTGKSKFIPCSREMVPLIRRGGWDVVRFHLLNRPRSRLLGGRTLVLGGSTDLQQLAPGVLAGDLSGIETDALPFWMRPYVFPPREIALLSNWEDKIERMADLALGRNIRAISGSPNWILVFLDRLARRSGLERPRLVDLFPDLELIIHGGTDIQPYRARFDELLVGSRAETREIYAASESVIAVADRGPGEGLRLLLDGGTFFEFVPVDELGGAAPTRHWIATVEPGVDYAIILTTCSGAWAYVLGDTVRFVDTATPRILVTGRTSQKLSAFGEHVITEELEAAVAAAAAAIGATVVEYCVAPAARRRAGDWQGHHYIVEFREPVRDARRIEMFGARLDARLQALNFDYAEQRAGEVSLGAPRIDVVAPGTFFAWMKRRGQLGGQHKVPRVINDPALFTSLLDMIAERADAG